MLTSLILEAGLKMLNSPILEAELRESGGCRAEGRPGSAWAQNVYQALVGVV